MTHPFTLPEQLKIVDATAGPVTTNGGVTSDYVRLGDAHKAFIVCQLTQAVGHATSIAVRKATAAAGTGVVAITVSQPIWANEDTAASDALVAKAAAVSYAVTNDIKKKIVVFQIDPASLGDTFDYLNFTVSDSSQATNFVAGAFYLFSRYPGATPPGGPTVIT